jgi:hypothetical protein
MNGWGHDRLGHRLHDHEWLLNGGGSVVQVGEWVQDFQMRTENAMMLIFLSFTHQINNKIYIHKITIPFSENLLINERFIIKMKIK